MASIPATIRVNFTANMIGQHRVCYRQGSSGAYTCTLVNCSAVGECEAEIALFVDNESCDEVQYTGYVQAACIEEGSTEDRVAFDVTFTPSPSCKSYHLICARLGIASVTITNGGSGYSSLSPPEVIFAGDGEVTYEVTVGEGELSAPVIVEPGSEYINGTYPNVPILGGTGTGAQASVEVNGNEVVEIIITTAGSGYTAGDTLYTLDASALGGAAPVVEVTFTATADLGKITGISVTNVTPFTAIPIITIAAGDTQATAVAVMEECPVINSPGCSGADIDIAAGSLTGFGESVTICGYTTPPVNTAYDITESGNCLCGCVSATIGVSGEVGTQVRYFYNKCGLEPRTGILTVGGSPSQVIDCIVSGSLTWQTIDEGTEGTVTYGDECP